MATQVFINLPVKDVQKSQAFYQALGWGSNPNFTDENAAAIVISDTIHVMLLSHDHYRRFTSKAIADTASTSAAIHALSVEAPEQIDDLLGKALAAGAEEGTPQDYGFMRSRTFNDPDGHPWEIMWMDPIAATGNWDAVQAKYPQAAVE
ncbi:VOC family protein [Kocuria rosea]|jgi:predicted lactoylglutathione lyase|uniref:VOC family protein n=1 Tax=Kocuria rosea TaxID=1275 RepID=UPI0020413E4D|nr:VOC family protein [Kocuria rosea]MCM3689380.1 VOC family protein [Kocuria rosea]